MCPYISLRKWPTHGKMYLEKCNELKIEPNPRALPSPEKNQPESQTSLDGFVQVKPSVRWSKEGLLEHILHFVISDDQVKFSFFFFDRF